MRRSSILFSLVYDDKELPGGVGSDVFEYGELILWKLAMDYGRIPERWPKERAEKGLAIMIYVRTPSEKSLKWLLSQILLTTWVVLFVWWLISWLSSVPPTFKITYFSYVSTFNFLLNYIYFSRKVLEPYITLYTNIHNIEWNVQVEKK